MNIPNAITFVRIFLIPVFVTLFLLEGVFPYARTAAAGVFALAAFTDFLDGFLARRLNQVTDMGKFLDAIADKMIVAAAFFLIIFDNAGGGTFIAPLIVCCAILTFLREFLISSLRMSAAAKGVVIAADKFGKVKTAVQCVGIPVMMACADFDALLLKNHNFELYSGTGIFLFIGMLLVVISTALAVLSGVNYMVRYRSVFK